MTRRRIVIVGAGGRLGAALHRQYSQIDEVTGFNHAQLDLGQLPRVRDTLGALDFDLLINCAAQTNVDRCEREPAEAFALNADAPQVLAEICAVKKARLIHISTDYVFEGNKTEPYAEEDEARPISVYGESKREGEKRVLAVDANHLVARVSWVFGPDRPSFVDWVIGQARERDQVEAVVDKFATPTYTCDVAEWLKPLFDSSAPGGLFHLANSGGCSWREYGQWALDCCRAEGIPMRAQQVGPTTLAAMKNFIARRPVYSVLAAGKYERLTSTAPRPWQEAVAAYVHDYVKPRTPV